MKPSLLSLLSLLSLTGCATHVWYQPGKSPEQAYQDLTEAKARATAALDPHGMGNLAYPWIP